MPGTHLLVDAVWGGMKMAYGSKGVWWSTPLIEFPILKASLGFLLSDERDDLDASFCNFDHPHDIHHIQNKTSSDPGTLDCKSKPYVGLCSVHGVHKEIQRRDCNDPHYEKDHCHEDSIDDVGFGKLGVLQGFKEPPGKEKGRNITLILQLGNLPPYSQVLGYKRIQGTSNNLHTGAGEWLCG